MGVFVCFANYCFVLRCLSSLAPRPQMTRCAAPAKLATSRSRPARVQSTRAGRPSINYNNRGYAYRGKGDMDRAIADYTEAIRLDPKYAIAYYNRGEPTATKATRTVPLPTITEAIRLDPKYAIAYNNRGVAYRDKGDTDRAIADSPRRYG